MHIFQKRLEKLPKGGIYITLLALFALILGSCSSYQYISIEGSMVQTDNKEFIIENDTVIIKYMFNGQNMPVRVNIFNKLFQPIYIDLDRSTAVIGNEQLTGPFFKDGQYGFIAPQSSLTLASNPLRYTFFSTDGISSNTVEKTKSAYGTNYSFNQISSPLHFRCILAIASNEYYDQPTFFDNSFWISDIFEPRSLQASPDHQKANQFYLKKKTAFGGFAGAMAIIALVIIGAI